MMLAPLVVGRPAAEELLRLSLWQLRRPPLLASSHQESVHPPPHTRACSRTTVSNDAHRRRSAALYITPSLPSSLVAPRQRPAASLAHCPPAVSRPLLHPQPPRPPTALSEHLPLPDEQKSLHQRGTHNLAPLSRAQPHPPLPRSRRLWRRFSLTPVGWLLLAEAGRASCPSCRWQPLPQAPPERRRCSPRPQARATTVRAPARSLALQRPPPPPPPRPSPQLRRPQIHPGQPRPRPSSEGAHAPGKSPRFGARARNRHRRHRRPRGLPLRRPPARRRRSRRRCLRRLPSEC